MVDSNYYAADEITGESKPLNQRYVKYNELGLATDSLCNTLWAWGWNCCGDNMLNTAGSGSDPTAQTICPTQEITSSAVWCHVSGHRCHTTAIKTDGTLWSAGHNAQGVLGDGTTVNHSSPVQEFCSSTDWCTSSQNGWLTTHAIKADGSLWSWGRGATGEFANNSVGTQCSAVQEYTSSEWCYVHRTDSSSFGIKTDSTLWGWGCNGANGFLGLNSTGGNYSSPVQEYTSSAWTVTSGWGSFISGLKTDGSIWTWGCGCGLYFGIGLCLPIARSSPVQEICSAANWCDVTSTLYGTYALKTDGTLWGWGRYNPSTVDSCSPVQEINSHTNWCLANGGVVHGGGIKTDGTLWSWGGITGTASIGDGQTCSRASPTQEYYSATNWYKYSGKTYGAIGLRIV